jgi:hypothetical protein
MPHLWRLLALTDQAAVAEMTHLYQQAQEAQEQRVKDTLVDLQHITMLAAVAVAQEKLELMVLLQQLILVIVQVEMDYNLQFLEQQATTQAEAAEVATILMRP